MANSWSADLDYRTTRVFDQCRTPVVLRRRLKHGGWAGNYPGCMGALEGVVVGKLCQIHPTVSMKVTLVPMLDTVKLLSIQHINLHGSDAFDLDVDITG